MKKKGKKKQKKKDKALRHSAGESRSALKALEKTVKRLEKEIRTRDTVIQDLNLRLNGGTGARNAMTDPGIRQKSSRASLAIAQRKAWKQHSYLRDRYEYHLAAGQDKTGARLLANQDLKTEFGQEAGYTEQELQHILS